MYELLLIGDIDGFHRSLVRGRNRACLGRRRLNLRCRAWFNLSHLLNGSHQLDIVHRLDLDATLSHGVLGSGLSRALVYLFEHDKRGLRDLRAC